MATFLGTESDNTTDYGNVSGDEDSTSMNSESEERDIDLIVQMMRSIWKVLCLKLWNQR